jgi:hypothetical protein
VADEKKGFLLRVPEPLLEELRRWAEQEMRSLNGQIEFLLRRALQQRLGRDPDQPDRKRRR